MSKGVIGQRREKPRRHDRKQKPKGIAGYGSSVNLTDRALCRAMMTYGGAVQCYDANSTHHKPGFISHGPIVDFGYSITVARRSFTRAARSALHDQPAVTFQIKQLEERFHTRLFAGGTGASRSPPRASW